MLEKIIKDYDKSEDAKVRVRVGRFAGFVGIAANVLLFGVKLFIGLFLNSISVIVDSLNNLSDAGSNVLTVVGYTVTGKPADKDHPYGHARMEYLCSLFISVIVAFLGLEMLKSSAEKLIGNSGAESYDTVGIIIIASTIIVKVLIALLYRKLGKHINSTALKASAADSISDVIATSAVIVGMLLTPYTGPKTDGVIGCLISVYIIVTGVRLVIESSNTLIGKAPNTEFISEIAKKIKSYDGVLGIHDLVIHSYGEGRCFATVHVEVDADGDIMESHDMIDNIEADFLKELNINLVIHMDPVCVSDPETNILREKCAKIVSDIASEYSSPVSMHDFRIVKGVTHTNIIFDISVSNDMMLTNEELCKEINEGVKAINPLYNLVLTIDRDYFSSRYEE
ncbi:MAG: cation diffusion facilitator family transporter [Eubacteriales bacterium]